MNRSRMRWCALLLAVTAVLLTGCGTLHNKGRFNTAQQASTAFDATKLSEALKDERTHNRAIFERELAAVDQLMRATRDAQLLAILNQPNAQAAANQLHGYVDERRRALGVDASKAFNKLRLRQATQQRNANLYLAIAREDDPDLRCSVNDPAPVFRIDSLRSRWENYQISCRDVAAAEKEVEALSTSKGELAAASLQLSELRKEKEVLTKAVKELTAAHKKEIEKLKQANAAPTSFADQAKAFKAQLNALQTISTTQLTSLGADRADAEAALAWLDELTAHIGTLLDAAKTGAKEVPRGVADELQIATILPSIAEELRAGFHYPRVSALVLESEHLRLERDRQKRILERLAEEETLLDAKRQLAIEELRMLGGAAGDLNELNTLPDCAATLLEKTTGILDAKPPCRRAIVSALLNYTNAWTLGRIPSEKIDWTRMNLSYERSLDNSEAGLMQWHNLIHVPLQALVRSYEGGVKAEDIGRLVHALELGAIGLVP